MKTFNFIYAFFMLLIVVSCSSEGGNEISNDDSFVYVYDDSNISITSWEAQRVEDTFVIIGQADDGQSFAIEFNAFGNLSSANSYSSQDFNFPLSLTYTYFSSNYFDFQIVGIDESNKRVSVTFNGNLYEDEYDLDSQSHTVEGSFNVEYIDNPSTGVISTMSAELDGDNWYSVSGQQTGGFFSGSNIELSRFNDDEFMISVIINDDNTEVGDYNFTSNATVNKVAFLEYNTATNDFEEYETIGTLNLVEKNVGIQFTQVKGTFSLTAVNGSNSVSVENGDFSIYYQNY